MTHPKTTRTCKICKQELPLEKFERAYFRGCPNGYLRSCTECLSVTRAVRNTPKLVLQCPTCGKALTAKPSKPRVYCSPECRSADIRGRKATPGPDWVIDTASDCWLWTGHVASRGYGLSMRGGVKRSAHRLVYEMMVGPIPKGMHLHHVCGEKECVNPAHIELVTPAEHVAIHAPHLSRRRKQIA